ncbi:MAG: translation initiation factor IF-2 [Chloroflexi bacterium]|nr:translation initiation factor IF-2 [Chloroflexota bacterium]
MTTRPSRQGARPVRQATGAMIAPAPERTGKEGPRKPMELPASITVKDLAGRLGVTPVQVIKQLMRNGIMANVNQELPYEVAAVVARDFNFEMKDIPKKLTAVAGSKKSARFREEPSKDQVIRPPVVTIMGHVDHGKTSLLDAIRHTNVIATEAGGITQHIGAYQVESDGKRITFLDTPGHEAFTAMRARGANVTDIAIIVVAADDGVMPQTVEAIDHARAAGVPVIVAINKIDKPGANPEKIKKQLGELGLVLEEWGGEVITVNVSAKKNLGIPELLENILVLAEVSELKASPNKPAAGTVVEAEMDKNQGPLATVLIQSGTLHVGDVVVVGTTGGKVKAMLNDKGKRVRKAEPAAPVIVLGLDTVPQAGDILEAVAGEKEARAILEKRGLQKQREAAAPKKAASLDQLYSQIREGQVKDLNIILKTDVQGSIEPIRLSLEKLSTDQVKVKTIHSGTGTITESDVLLAIASRAIIIGFNSKPEPGAKKMAELEGVDIRNYSVIYNLVEDVEKAMKGMLEPVYEEVVDGRATVKSVFPSGKKTRAAGCQVNEGKLVRAVLARVVRAGKVIHQSTIASLRRFKEDVKEVATGFECGVGVDGFNDFVPGDVIEAYHKERTS